MAAPKFEEKQMVWINACPRENCGGSIGRFNYIEGDEFKCLRCGREVQPNAIRRD